MFMVDHVYPTHAIIYNNLSDIITIPTTQTDTEKRTQGFVTFFSLLISSIYLLKIMLDHFACI